MFKLFSKLFRKAAPPGEWHSEGPEEWGYCVHVPPITSAEECAEVIRRGELVNMFCSEWANWRDEYGCTLLHLAAELRNPRNVKLLRPYFDPNTQNNSGSTPLHAAAGRGSSETVKALIEAGADINAYDNFRRTPIFYSVLDKNADTLYTLLEAGAAKNARDFFGFTARDYAGKLSQTLTILDYYL